MPATQAFVLMNLDLIAVPLQVGGAGLITIYCGARRASQLLDGLEPAPCDSAETASGLESDARRAGDDSGGQTLACKSTIARSVAPLQSR